MIVEYMIFSLNLAFVGLLDDPIVFSGVGLGGLTSFIIVFAIGLGIWGGIDTLVSQAYGRKDYAYWKVCLNTWRLFICAIFILQIIVLGFSDKIFVMIGQPVESSIAAWKYIVACLPGFFFQLQFEWMRRYLLAIEIYLPCTIIFIITLVVHVIWLSVFTLVIDYGIIGVGTSTSITFTLNFVLIVIYTKWHADPVVQGSWKVFDPMIIKSIPEYLKYGVTACLAQILCWAPFELTVAYGGLLGITQLTCSTVLNSILFILTGIPYGFTLTAAGMIGFNLGANCPNKAWRYAISTVILGCSLALLIIMLIASFKTQILNLYGCDEDMIELINSVMIIYNFFIINWVINIIIYSITIR